MRKTSYFTLLACLFVLNIVFVSGSIVDRGITWDLEEVGNEYKKTYYSGPVNMPAENGTIYPFEDLVVASIQNKRLVFSYNIYLVEFEPQFYMQSGQLFGVDDIPSTITVNPWKHEYRGSIKYGIDFYNVSTNIKNNLQYFILKRSRVENLNAGDVVKDGNSLIVKNKIRFSHDDILQNYTIPLINLTHIVVGNLTENFVDNGDGTWNISFDPTASYNFSDQNNIFVREGQSCSNSINLSNLMTPLSTCDNLADLTADEAFDASDNNREGTSTNSGTADDGAFLIFWVNVQETPSSISLINWTYEGYTEDVSEVDPDMYLWNATKVQWKFTANSPLGEGSGNEATFYYSTTDITDHLNNTNSTHFGVIDTESNSVGLKRIYTDYVALEVTYDPSPKYSNLANNASSTKITEVVKWNVTLTDDSNLDAFIFAHNQSGTMTNITTYDITGTSYLASYNLTITLNYTNYICGQFWFNDTNGNVNATTESCFTVANTIPTFNQSLTNQSLHHNVNFRYDINCSDPDLPGSITYYDNTSLFNINVSNGSITDNPAQNEVGNYTINISCGDGTANVSETFNYEIINFAPNITNATGDAARVTPTSPGDLDDLTCHNGTIADYEGDTVSLTYDWYKDSVAQGLDTSILSDAFTSVGENWKCEITPNDGQTDGAVVTSAEVSIGTSNVAPSINWTNATTNATGINSTSTNPTNNDSWVNLSVTFYDANANELHTAYFCLSDNANADGCTGGTYCSSTANQTGTTLTCALNTTGYTPSSLPYYVYVVDNSSLVSSSVSNTFDVNHPPKIPSLVEPINNQFINLNWTIVNYSSTDSDSDVINYTLYNSTDNTSFTLASNSSNSYFNWTNLVDGTYYIMARTLDQHHYSNNINTSSTNFTIDTTYPSVSGVSVTTTAGSQTITFQHTASDTYLNNCTYSIYNSSGSIDGILEDIVINCNQANLQATVSAYGTYKIQIKANDLASNQNHSNKSFTTRAASAGGPGGAGGATTLTIEDFKSECNIILDEENLTFFSNINVLPLLIKNNENFSITPSYLLDIAFFEVRGPAATIPSNSNMQVSVIKNYLGNETIQKEMIIKTADCKDITIPIIYLGTEKEFTPTEIAKINANKLFSFITENVKLLGFPIPFYVIMLLILLIVILLIRLTKIDLRTKVLSSIFLAILISSVIGLIIIPSEKEGKVLSIGLNETLKGVNQTTDIIKDDMLKTTINGKEINISYWLFGISIFLLAMGIFLAINMFDFIISFINSILISIVVVLLTYQIFNKTINLTLLFIQIVLTIILVLAIIFRSKR